ncbi:SAM-dependent methyltransferase [Agaribacterium sp. ZY112]|uniref:SAM-dependent methyltransferase n=1 Tax=Agaribacterium sp. ZY112 TaxID=3233574 RepID=UPI003525854E
MNLNDVVPWGRSLREYQQMFSLNQSDLDKRILGCSDGPASFNAELTKKGGKAVSIDPTYQFEKHELEARITEVYDQVMAQMRANQEHYIWKDIESVDALGKTRMSSMKAFIDDYEQGKQAGRYQYQALPSLNFKDNEFDLALCSHYLFLYSEHVSYKQHLLSILELCRVASEVRIYPLLTLANKTSPYLSDIITELDKKALSCSLVKVYYQFQKGATQMLVIKRA